MKDVTLKEFIEIAKDNNQLKDKVVDTVKVSGGGKLPDDLYNIAAEAGYNITRLNTAGFSMNKKGQLLSDSTLNNVSGGFIDKYDLCETLMDLFGCDREDLEYCSEKYD